MALRTVVVVALWAGLALGLGGCPSSARVEEPRDLAGEWDAVGADLLTQDGDDGGEAQVPEAWDGWEGPGPEGHDWLAPEGWDGWEAQEAEDWDGWDGAEDARPEEWVGPEGFEGWEAWEGWEWTEAEWAEVFDVKEAWDTAEGKDTVEAQEAETWDTTKEEAAPECQVDADCNDHDPCTQDRCSNDNTCVHEPKGVCCVNDNDCEDGDLCTDQACDYGDCHYAFIPGCCSRDNQCHDGNPCTSDTCVDGACVFTQVYGCCTQPSDCSDGNLCTWDLCTNGTCYFYPTTEHPGCCDGEAACDDSDPCTRDACGADWHCAYVLLEGCCTGDAACDDGDPCSVDKCDAGVCAHLPDFAPECCQPSTWYFNGFESGQAGDLKLEPLDKSVGWSVSSKRAADGSHYSLYFGDPLHGSFEIPGQASLGSVTLPAIELPPLYPARFTMQAWLDVEAIPNYDRLWVEVVSDGLAATVWDKIALPPSQYRTWVTVNADLTPWAGRVVKVRVRFDSVDAMENTGEGVYLDVLRLEGLCQPYSPLAADEDEASPR